MILITSPRSVNITAGKRPPPECPSRTNRRSPSECRGSSTIRPSGSPKTVAASPNDTPCFARLPGPCAGPIRRSWTCHHSACAPDDESTEPWPARLFHLTGPRLRSPSPCAITSSLPHHFSRYRARLRTEPAPRPSPRSEPVPPDRARSARPSRARSSFSTRSPHDPRYATATGSRLPRPSARPAPAPPRSPRRHRTGASPPSRAPTVPDARRRPWP